jgi:hypothetical protein
MAEIFVEQLVTGVGLKRSDPVYVARERILREAANRTSLNRNDKLRLIFSAWNNTRAGKPMKRAAVKPKGGKSKMGRFHLKAE